MKRSCAAFPRTSARKAVSRLNKATHDLPAQQLKDLARLHTAGRMQELLALADQLTETHPRSETVWTFLGAAAEQLGRLDLAATAFTRAADLQPNKASVHANLGALAERSGAYSDAIAHYSRAIGLAPRQPEYLLFRGATRLADGDAANAVTDLQASLAIAPDNAKTLRYLGQALYCLGRFDDAGQTLEQVVKLNGRDVTARVQLAEAYIELGNHTKALTHLEAALACNPDDTKALMSMGTLCLIKGQASQAMPHYTRAVQNAPTDPQIWNNLSSAQFATGAFEQAEISARKALALNPEHARAHHNLANVQQQTGQLDLAVRSYQKAVELAPTLDLARVQMLYFKARICDWSAYSEFAQVSETLGLSGEITPPFPLLNFEDAPDRQQRRSQRYAAQWRMARHRFDTPQHGGRLRIGYFSSDLYDHATLTLLNGVLEHHDKTRFDIAVYGLNAPRPSAQFERMKAAVDRFVDLHSATDDEIVQRARADNLDIAIDLKGYTHDARPGPFFAGLAPVQINYLGYPGTLGSESYDYIVADDMVLPAQQRAHYSESILYLPHSYQPNDDNRRIADIPVERSEFGLPEKAVVLCCFNNSYKITPVEFDIWMRVLRHNDRTVLWLLGDNTWAQSNLRREAEKRGVDASRLVFAKRVPLDQHLARHRLADLFLDTFNVNAHTTASDALYAGLPVITRPGAQFAARVGASLCRAVGLTETITTDESHYEEVIKELAQDTERRQALRARLADALPSARLFDTATYTQHLEAGYCAAWKNRCQDRPPADIRVPG
ncbi:tetratricopeptide repeat protein [Rhodobacteraceae bacterium F11138]|nr:tetratricopeptide repeat protein [Rhodobacteraceae bacterium F11138]